MESTQAIILLIKLSERTVMKAPNKATTARRIALPGLVQTTTPCQKTLEFNLRLMNRQSVSGVCVLCMHVVCEDDFGED